MDLTPFEKYSLSDESKSKLKNYETLLSNQDSENSNSLWHKLFHRDEHKDQNDDTEQNDDKEPIAMGINDNDLSTNNIESMNEDHLLMPSSQFFFTQVKKQHPLISVAKRSEGSELDGIVDTIYESLENNKILDTDILKNLSDGEVSNIIEILSQRLDIKGTFALCNSVCEMDLDLGIQYVKIICSKLLLPKITELTEPSKPSRQMSVVIPKIAKKFPEDIERLIYIPLINVDLQNPSIMLTIIRSYVGEQKMKLISGFLMNVRELKSWHTTILPVLIDIKIDISLKERLLTLLTEKATVFSKDKNYSQFILSFTKLNPPYSEEQKNNLEEIAAVNETLFKKPVENILMNMYHHHDLWHIN